MSYLKNYSTVKKELAKYILEKIKDSAINNDNIDDWHHRLFNEHYYIVYHSTALNWLNYHDIDVFEAINTVKEYEQEKFDKMTTSITPKSIVNMLVYILGKELINSEDFEKIKQLKKAMKNILK